MNRGLALALSLLLLTVLAADAQTPAELKGLPALVSGVVFGPDGKLLATAGFDNSVKTWDSATGKKVKPLFATPGRSTRSRSVRMGLSWHRPATTRRSSCGT